MAVTPSRFSNEQHPRTQLEGYSTARQIQEQLRSIGSDNNLEVFFKDSSEKDYYRFFRPLAAAHPHPYYSVPASPRPSADPYPTAGPPLYPDPTATYISVHLHSLGNVKEGEDTIRAVFKILATWKPVLPEIRHLVSCKSLQLPRF